MPKRSSREKDENEIASSIIDQLTVGSIPAKKPTNKKSPQKNPAAVALGRLGGLKGGKARAEKLSARRRKEIAKKAAQARWINKIV